MKSAATLPVILLGLCALPAPALAQDAVDFGDDSGDYANDGECDDPRFAGEGMAAILLQEDRKRDASDCAALFNAGKITYIGMENRSVANVPSAPPPIVNRVANSIDFGDDSSEWANDGECDDPRFSGPGMAGILLSEDTRRDATDCRTLYASGRITLKPAMASTTAAGAIDFGDDSSDWANDDECDDPRFRGEGMADILLAEDAMRDATDCRALFDAGSIELIR